MYKGVALEKCIFLISLMIQSYMPCLIKTRPFVYCYLCFFYISTYSLKYVLRGIANAYSHVSINGIFRPS